MNNNDKENVKKQEVYFANTALDDKNDKIQWVFHHDCINNDTDQPLDQEGNWSSQIHMEISH